MSEPSRYRRTVHISEALAAVMAGIDTPAQPAHSLNRHPLRELLTAEEYSQLSTDVQHGRCSWPVAIDVQEPVHG